MKRYRIILDNAGPECRMHEATKGDWCRYEDVKDFIDMAYHEYEPRPDGKRCRVCKEKEEHAMHHWQPDPPEKSAK